MQDIEQSNLLKQITTNHSGPSTNGFSSARNTWKKELEKHMAQQKGSAVVDHSVTRDDKRDAQTSDRQASSLEKMTQPNTDRHLITTDESIQFTEKVEERSQARMLLSTPYRLAAEPVSAHLSVATRNDDNKGASSTVASSTSTNASRERRWLASLPTTMEARLFADGELTVRTYQLNQQPLTSTAALIKDLARVFERVIKQLRVNGEVIWVSPSENSVNRTEHLDLVY